LCVLQADGSLPTPTKVLHGAGNLTIVNLGKEDDGVYECVAANVVSSIITTSLLIIESIQSITSRAYNLFQCTQK